MEKRTLLAVALSMVVMLVFFWLQATLYPPPEPVAPTGQTPPEISEFSTPSVPAPLVTPPEIIEETGPSQDSLGVEVIADETVPARNYFIETNRLSVILTNVGGEIVSYIVKDPQNRWEPEEMILHGDAGPQAFAVAFGNYEDLIAKRIKPVERNFQSRRISDLIIEFYQDFQVPSGGIFTMTKRYEFKPNEYMFELTVTLNGGNSISSFDFSGAAYTLVFGPQIGPEFERLDQRYEYRRYITYKGKMKTERVTERDPAVITTQPTWAAIAGKYFTLMALPLASQFNIVFSMQAETGLPAASRLYITRPAASGSRIEDKYNFYLGPKNLENLNVYKETNLFEIANSTGILSWLEDGLKWLLELFQKIVKNWGVAIILLTILVKLVLFPLTKKGSESTLRMQALSPKIKEIQAKYKDNPQKMNAEMAEFYKKEGYNPLSGCLPMLLQMPIFFAMYNLFNNHFDLRGAMFIPGWIPDLSLPESIYDFPDNFRLPLLGWTALRLLPFIYVGSQLLYGKVTQTPDQQGNSQMKIMLYAMPVIFFFILYDVPSGLLVYWIMSNLLTMVQQVAINKFLAAKKAAMAVAEPKPVIAPPPSGPKKKRKK